MSSRQEHPDVSAGQFRHALLTAAEVTEQRLISPTVLSLMLKVEDPKFGFHAGQWVDFCIPGTDMVGGYSMCSTPSQLQDSGTLELAVKRSSWPPAIWIHQQCHVGSRVTLRAGGDLFLAPSAEDLPRPLLLVAGGVGINPLISILRHMRHLRVESRRTGAGYEPAPIELLYSCRGRQELLFKDCIFAMARERLVTASLFVTGENSSDEDHSYHDGRLGDTHVRSAVARLGGQPLCLLCGPSGMVAAVEHCLRAQLGLPADSVRYERWW